MSVWQTPHAASRTSASPAFGSSSSTSWTASGCPNSSRTAALIFILRELEVGGRAGGILVVRLGAGLLVPGIRVRAVVEVAGERRQAQRVERVAHDRELVRLGQPDRLLGEPGMRPVRNSGGMQRDRSDVDGLPR